MDEKEKETNAAPETAGDPEKISKPAKKDSRRKKKRARRLRILIIILAVVIILSVGAVLFFSKYAVFDGQLVRRNTDSLDLRGDELTEEQYEQASELFPDAHILRDVVIGGQTFDADAESIVTGDFTAEDIPAFADFRQLKSADVSACTDIAVIQALRDALPETDVFYTVTLGSESIDGDAETISESGIPSGDLMAAMDRLPNLKTVTVEDNSLTPQEQKALVSRYPQVEFQWDVTLAGKHFTSGDEVLDFSGTKLTEEQLAEIGEGLDLLPNGTTVDLTDCGLSDSALKAFADAHPERTVGWNTSLFGVDFSTLDTEICFDNIALTIEDASQIEDMLPYMHNLEKVFMCDCGISDEDMDALNNRHEDVRFVWMVQLRTYGLRTDRTYFCLWNCDRTYDTDNMTYVALKYCTDIEALDLGHQKVYNNDLGASTGGEFLACLPHLKYLTLCDCQYTSVPALADCHELVFLEVYWTNMDDLTPLKDLTNLRALNIAYKRVRDRENDIEVLSGMTWLEKLYVSSNMYYEEELDQLRAALPNTEIRVIETENCCSEGWRNDNKYYYDYRDALHMYYISDDSYQIDVNPFTGERSLYEDTNPFR